MLAALGGATLAACSGEYPQSTIAPTTEFGDVIHGLYVQVFWWTMVILAVVWIVLAYVLVRFRERPDGPKPKPIHGHLGLEIGWTVGPALIVIAIAIPTIRAVFATQEPISEDAMVVHVTGNRFWWKFEYPDLQVRTANELHLPVGRPVSLRLASQDVIHSFWVPRLGGKRDVNPVVVPAEGEEELYTWLYFTPRETGVFMGQCAEFCGPSHALMGLRVIVESEEEFEDWVTRWRTVPAAGQPAAAAGDAGADALDAAAGGSEAAEPDPAAQETEAPAQAAPPEDPRIAEGRELFLRGNGYCVLCHAINGVSAGPLGPDLTLVGSRTTIGAGLLENTPENMFAWIKDPASFKPGVMMPGVTTEGFNPGATPFAPTELTDDQIRAIVTYLQSLR